MIDNNSRRYHTALSEYFYSKKYPVGLQNWDNCNNRILSELPFQTMYSASPQNIENFLCNPLFIEASIKGGLLNNLIEDINISCGKLGFKNIIPVKDSIYDGLAAIRQRPRNSIYTLINRLIHAESNSIAQPFLSSTIDILNKRGVWFRTKNKFPSTQYIKGVIAVNTKRKSFYTLKNNNGIEEYEIETQNLKNVSYINETNTIFDISINTEIGRIAILTADGSLFIDSDQTRFKLKTLYSCFSWFDGGILGVNKNSYLAFLDLNINTESILWNSPISPFSLLSVSADSKTGVFISGDRLPGQKILLIQTHNGIPKCSEWMGVDSIVKAACLDQQGLFMILSTQSRELLLFNIKTEELKKVPCRLAAGFPVRGSVFMCILSKLNEQYISICATNDGELLIWDTTMESIKRRGTYKGVRQQTTIHAMEFLPGKDKFILATGESLEILPIFGDEITRSKDPVTNCCLSNDEWLITINEYGKKVTWTKDEKHISDFIINNYQPISITSFGENGAVVVGYSNGMVVKLHPDVKPGYDDAIDLFDSPVIGVIQIDSIRILAASEKGEFRIIKFYPDAVEREIKPVGIIRKEHFIRQLGNGDNFVTSGRYHSGESLWSVVVVRSDSSREVVVETKEMVIDLAANENGNTIYIAFGGNVNCYNYRQRQWKLMQTRGADVIQMTFCQNDHLAITLRDKGMNWLELWDTTDQLQTVAALELPFQPSCICSNKKNIGIGTIDGNHLILETQYEYSTQNT